VVFPSTDGFARVKLRASLTRSAASMAFGVRQSTERGTEVGCNRFWHCARLIRRTFRTRRGTGGCQCTSMLGLGEAPPNGAACRLGHMIWILAVAGLASFTDERIHRKSPGSELHPLRWQHYLKARRVRSGFGRNSALRLDRSMPDSRQRSSPRARHTSGARQIARVRTSQVGGPGSWDREICRVLPA
jgi:hypothetical protein